jgi:hypothetical protein
VTEQASSMWRDAFSYSQNSTGSTELSKSASVLKAIEQVVGEEKFLSAIKVISNKLYLFLANFFKLYKNA